MHQKLAAVVGAATSLGLFALTNAKRLADAISIIHLPHDVGEFLTAMSETPALVSYGALVIGIACLAYLALGAWRARKTKAIAAAPPGEVRGKEKADKPKLNSVSQEPIAAPAQGGKGGSGEIFGNHGTIIGGRGGNVGPGCLGRGGDGGGGIIHGDGGTIIGGEGGSVDGVNIWFPPAQSGFIHFLESEGQTPDFNVQYPGAGGATGGWLQRQHAVVKIREEYFKNIGQEAKIRSSKIEDVPLDYINKRLKEAGEPWRARVERKYWYLYYIPSDH